MPLLTTVIDDKSPLISYDSTWLPGNSWDDQLASCYYSATFTTNNVTDGSVTFDFNGTAVWVYGANRPNHGSYTVQVDSQTFSGYNGAGNNLFQQSLFNISTLSQGTHTLKLTNTATGSLYVDIDMIVWQSEVGDANTELVPEVVQDTDPRFQYQAPAWGTTSTSFNFNLFNNGSGHVTETYDASVSFTFTGTLFLRHICAVLTGLSGEAVTLFGTSGPDNGPYSVQLDGGQAATYNATNAFPTNYGVVIYHADNLGSGSHQIVLTNLPAASGQALTIDHAQLWTLANSTSTTTSGGGNGSSPNAGSVNSLSSSQNNLSSGAVAGIAVATVFAVLGAAAAIFFYRCWKAAESAQVGLYRHPPPQQRPSELVAGAATGYSSSLEARTISQAGMAPRPGNNYSAQQDGAAPPSSGSRDSRSIMDTANSPTQSSVDEVLVRRPLPEAPGGGLSLAAEFPKLSGVRRGLSTGHSSVAMSDVPPDYIQATTNAGPSRA